MKQLLFRHLRQDLASSLNLTLLLEKQKKRNRREACYHIFQEDFFWGFYLVFSSKVKHKARLYLPGPEESQFREKVSPTQSQGPVPTASGSEQG